MQILAEAATQDVFTPAARQRLELACALLMKGAKDRIAEAIEVLEHDGYLEVDDDGHRFLSRLLKDWWVTRFRGHHIPLDDPDSETESEKQE